MTPALILPPKALTLARPEEGQEAAHAAQAHDAQRAEHRQAQEVAPAGALAPARPAYLPALAGCAPAASASAQLRTFVP